MALRNKLKTFLEARDVSRYRFVKDTGFSSTTVYALSENPDRIPSGIVLAKICDLYQVQPSELLEWVAPIAPIL